MFRVLFSCLILFSAVSLASGKSIEEFTESLQHKPGFIDLYFDADKNKVFLKISKFDNPILFQSSLPRGVGSNDIGLDRGQLGDTRIVQFERFGNKVLLKQLNTDYVVLTDNLAERESIDEAFADSVLAGLPVVASSEGTVLVDYTDFLLSDIHGVSSRLERTKQGSYKVDTKRSGVYLPRTKAFPENSELEALVTFVGKKPGNYVRQVTPEPTAISVHLHHSFIKLPDDGYQPRAFHPYSGFWKMSYQDYGTDIESSMTKSFIPRHRLSKKEPSAQRSEAVEPIVYYLDPGIPEPVKSALYDGALWWDQAFQAIGYKNAFQVKTLPADADPMDVRYNVIQWVHRATRGWSYGSSVIDPRTGEIIKGHVTLGSLRVRQDYLIALGLTSPFTKGTESTEKQKEMALARIRQLSAHEVGHTLGIAHNFAASGNDRASVMDYPHPKISIVKGKISLEGAYDDKIGVWDKHVIAYGYQDLGSANTKEFLEQQIASTRSSGLRYMSDADSRSPLHSTPVGHLWDNGKDPIEEFDHLSEVRKLALQNFGIRTLKKGQSLSSLEETLVPIYLLHRFQLHGVAKLIGGYDYQYELRGDFDTPRGITPVSVEQQQAALNRMLKAMSFEYLRMPAHVISLIPPKAYGERRNRESFSGRTGITFDPISAGEAAANNALSLLINPIRLNRVHGQAALHQHSFTASYVIDQLLENIFYQKATSDDYLSSRTRMMTVDALVQVLLDKDTAPEVMAVVQLRLMNLHTHLKDKEDEVSVTIAMHLFRFFKTGEWSGEVIAKPLPPGSPI